MNPKNFENACHEIHLKEAHSPTRRKGRAIVILISQEATQIEADGIDLSTQSLGGLPIIICSNDAERKLIAEERKSAGFQVVSPA